MFTKALIICALLLVGCGPPYEGKKWDTWRCSFFRLDGVYTVSGRELHQPGTMITVHRGTRSFMFKRSAIERCEKDADQT